MNRNVMIIAGEPSGDMHAARLVVALRARGAKDIHLWGIGGDALQREGVEILQHVRSMAVMGVVEVLKRYRFFRGVFEAMLKEVQLRQPEAVILVDYPGFNMRFAQAVHAMGVHVIYYICPQVWAWNRHRIKKIAKIVDRLLVVFPFEVGLFSKTGLRVDYVGHPLVHDLEQARQEPLLALPWEGPLRVALLPGSRFQEVRRILPTMLAAARLLEREFSEKISFLIAAGTEENAMLVARMLKKTRMRPRKVQIVTGLTRQVLRQARTAMVTSGTATMEAALLGCPMIVVYKTSWLNYALARMLIHVPHIGMVNILAGTELCPEFIQTRATAKNLAAGLRPLLSDTTEYSEMTMGFNHISRCLGDADAALWAADLVIEELARARICLSAREKSS